LSDYVGTFGYLYNWYAAADSRKLCPAGWHVPSDAEWTTLIQIIDPTASASVLGTQSTSAGTVMKSTVTNTTTNVGFGWNPGSPGTDTRGFSALPSGYRNLDGSFSGIRNFTYIWSATENPSATGDARLRTLSGFSGNVGRVNDSKTLGASVRCLRD
jgi:uncharacterized protein (TIGR02145 family)